MSDRVVYKDSGEILHEEDIKRLPIIGKGFSGTIYRYDEDKVIKLMNKPSRVCSFETLDTIKNLQLPNFYRIYNLLSDGVTLNQYVGNIASYHKEETVDIWNMPSDWLIENYEGLYEAMTKLGEQQIEIYDALPCNCIVNKSGMTLIDVDRYFEDPYNCTKSNIRLLVCKLLRPLLEQNFMEYHSDLCSSDLIYSLLKSLFSSYPENEKELSKKLLRYSRPIDYIKDRICK